MVETGRVVAPGRIETAGPTGAGAIPGYGPSPTYNAVMLITYVEEGREVILRSTADVNDFTVAQQQAKWATAEQAKTVQSTNGVYAASSAGLYGYTRSIHMANMAVLGMNMSLLGLTWNLQRTGLFSKRATDEITHMIAPVQMVASVINFAASAFQLMVLWNQIASVQYSFFSQKMIVQNGVLSFSFTSLRISILSCMTALGGLAALFGFLIAESIPVKVVLGGLASAMLAYSIKTWLATIANIAFIASHPFVGWLIVWGVLAALLASVAVVQSKYKSIALWRGGIAKSRTSATIGEAGPEAVIPIGSPEGRRMLRERSWTDGVPFINHASFYVAADRPATLYRRTDKSVRRQKFIG